MNKISISFCTSVSALEKANEIAREEKISRSQLMCYFLDWALEEYEKNIKNVPSGGTSLVY